MLDSKQSIDPKRSQEGSRCCGQRHVLMPELASGRLTHMRVLSPMKRRVQVLVASGIDLVVSLLASSLRCGEKQMIG